MKYAADERIATGALAPAQRREPAQALGDLRFHALLGAAAWAELPPATQRRFSKWLVGARTAADAGEVAETRISRAGWLFSQAARLIGTPLPLGRDAFVPATTEVAKDEASGGQLWARVHGRRGCFPHVIRMAKRFAGPTGLEEYLGRGIGIALAVAVENQALCFRSAGCFLELFGRRVALPGWLGLPRLTVSHMDCRDGWFAFVLDLRHPRLGELIHHTVLYAELRAAADGETPAAVGRRIAGLLAPIEDLDSIDVHSRRRPRLPADRPDPSGRAAEAAVSRGRVPCAAPYPWMSRA
jgi:hypothetical protein